jgi:hypothetical protein
MPSGLLCLNLPEFGFGEFPEMSPAERREKLPAQEVAP